MKKIFGSISRLEVISFLVGVAILTFELVAARVVSPYLGDTVYTWTSIIGVILAALAAGYAVGGKLADERKKEDDITLLLLVSSILIAGMNIIKDPVLAALAETTLPLQLKAFIASLFLFAPPTLLLGIIAPYLARLSIDKVSTSGRHLSRVDAAGTVGSLIGTFATGYFLFGLIGTRNLLTYIAVGLVLVTLLIKSNSYRALQITALAFVALTGLFAPKPYLSGFLKEIDTAYSRIIIRDIQYEGKPVRAYQTDGRALQSGVFADGSNGQPFAYIRGFSYMTDLKPRGNSYLIIGGGAFTFPSFLAEKEKNATIDTVEIDKQLPEISKQYFGFKQPKNANIIVEDGRTFLNNNQKKYDMIFLDAFSASSIPFQLITKESANKMARSLRKDGVVVANIISPTIDTKRNIMNSTFATFKTEFPNVEMFPVRAVPATTRQNILLIASKQPIDFNRLTEADQSNAELQRMLRAHLAVVNNRRYILTDDFAPVEQMVL